LRIDQHYGPLYPNFGIDTLHKDTPSDVANTTADHPLARDIAARTTLSRPNRRHRIVDLGATHTPEKPRCKFGAEQQKGMRR